MRRRVAITGVGAVSAQGMSAEATWRGVLAGEERLRAWGGISENHPLRRIVVGACAEELRAAGGLPGRFWKQLSRTQQLAALAAEEAVGQAGLGGRMPAEAGMFLATTVCGMDQNERFYAGYRGDPGDADLGKLKRLRPEETAEFVRRILGLEPRAALQNTCLSTCVGSAMAVAQAADAIELGECDVVLAGGAEGMCRVTLSGFHALKVAAAGGCRPFDKDRPGMTVGEGAGMLLLESESHARERGARIMGYVRGAGITCDAYHLTAPDPSATQPARAIRDALQRAGLQSADIDYINAHGTGTRDNDAMEAKAFAAVFGEAIPPVSSTKRATGHTFGAAGAIEAIICVLALRDQAAPPNMGSVTPDAALWPGVDPVIRGSALGKTMRHALSTNFAFGGNNTALVISSEGG